MSTSLELATPRTITAATPEWLLLTRLLVSFVLPSRPVTARHVAPRRGAFRRHRR